MNKKLKIATIVIAFFAIIVIVSFNTIISKTADWEFIQNVGGIKTGIPLKTEDGFYLPVVCNVSGLDSVTIKPITINSALSCVKINVKVDKNNIYLKVITGIAKSQEDDCNCKATRIGFLKKGIYKVYYDDKKTSDHLIGQFEIE